MNLVRHPTQAIILGRLLIYLVANQAVSLPFAISIYRRTLVVTHLITGSPHSPVMSNALPGRWLTADITYQRTNINDIIFITNADANGVSKFKYSSLHEFKGSDWCGRTGICVSCHRFGCVLLVELTKDSFTNAINELRSGKE
jgi:hypothetical protein